MLSNHRGITTSSSIGTIVDSLIHRRITSTVTFTPAQGGGKSGMAPCDHLFVLRAIINISITQKRATFLTFFDISKAYDRVDNEDLLVTMWDKGLKGKAWRILRKLNVDLSSIVKTRFGDTKEFNMEIGGKQGSKLTGCMFAKMVDLLAEEFLSTKEGFYISEDLIIAFLLWVDDIVSCIEGTENLKKALEKINEFAVKHKIKWSNEKCNVMKIGKHDDEDTEWKVGEMTIQETSKYKYLGDIITNDGKNTENLKARKTKLQGTTININTIASSEILNKIETTVLLELHEKINVSSLLTNAESWTLSKGDEKELEKTEIMAIKHLFNLPTHIPSVAILYTFGIKYTTQRVHQMQLFYLHKVLHKGDIDWTRPTLNALKELNTGWYKHIQSVLKMYELPTDFDTIRLLSVGEWIYNVKKGIESKHKEKLLDDCHKMVDGEKIKKTKTSTIVDNINNDYVRKPLNEIKNLSKNETRTLMMARYGMLQCGKNYGGSMQNLCPDCNCLDDENHRLNFCPKWSENNQINTCDKVSFEFIYSNDENVLKTIIPVIEKLWNTKTGHGKMNVCKGSE